MIKSISRAKQDELYKVSMRKLQKGREKLWKALGSCADLEKS